MSAPRLSAILLPALGACTLLVTSCGTDNRPAADPARPCAAADSLATARGIDAPTGSLTLLDAGAAPRQRAVVAPGTAAPQTATLTTASRETSVVTGQASAPSTTSEDLTLPLTARTVCDDPARTELTFGAPTSPDAALTPQLAGFDGALGGLRFGPEQTPTQLQIAPPEGAPAPASRAVEQSLLSAVTYWVPLPDAEIGVGARWRIARSVWTATTVTQTMDVTLLARDGNRLTLQVTIDETPDSPVFRIPGSSQTLDLRRYSNSGGGTVTVDLADRLPISGSLTLNGARELAGDDPAKPIMQQTGLTISWR